MVYLQAKSFHEDLQDALQRLTDIDGQLITSTIIGGLPDSAREQLDKFMVSHKYLNFLVNHSITVTFILTNYAVVLLSCLYFLIMLLYHSHDYFN